MNTPIIRKAKRPYEIVEIVAEYLKEGDLEGIVSMFHPDCEICFPPEEPSKSGKEGAREVFAEFSKLKPILIGEVTGEKIIGDTALMQGKWRIEDQSGTLMAEGISTEVAKMLPDGSWVYFIDCPLGAPPYKRMEEH